MSTRNQSLFEAILARISFGSVPVDGMYWFDPRAQFDRSSGVSREHGGCSPHDATHLRSIP
jgi:hypothetical protein